MIPSPRWILQVWLLGLWGGTRILSSWLGHNKRIPQPLAPAVVILVAVDCHFIDHLVIANQHLHYLLLHHPTELSFSLAILAPHYEHWLNYHQKRSHILRVVLVCHVMRQ